MIATRILVESRCSALVCSTADGLEDLTGLGHIETPFTINLYDNANLRSLAGLSLSPTGSGVMITESPVLADLDELGGATSLSRLWIENLPTLTDASAAASLDEIGSLVIQYTALASLDAFRNVKLTDGLTVAWNPLLTQIDAIAPRAEIGVLSVGENALLTHLPAFPGMSSDVVEIDIDENPLLAIGPEFPNVAQVSDARFSDGRIGIEGNASLSRFDGLSALSDADSISIRNNGELEELDLASLKSARSLTITCNPQLPDASVAALARVAPNPVLEGNLGSAEDCQE